MLRDLLPKTALGSGAKRSGKIGKYHTTAFTIEATVLVGFCRLRHASTLPWLCNNRQQNRNLLHTESDNFLKILSKIYNGGRS